MRSLMLSAWTAGLLTVLVFRFATLVRGSAQELTPPNRQAIFDPIPEDKRSAFIGRMQSVVRDQGAHDWGQLYELLALPNPKSKAEFVAFWKKYDGPGASFILEFRPDHLTKLPAVPEQKYQWIVSGCAKFRAGGRTENHQSSVYSLFRDGNWYFSEVMINVRCGPNDLDPCQQQNAPGARK
jgi:hypothetical protein